MDDRNLVHKYWKYPLPNNLPERYMRPGRNRRSDFLIDIMRKIGVETTDSILEIGCNAGRNLIRLWGAGYQNLAGIEICPEAVELMAKTAPELAGRVSVGAVEDVLPEMPAVDVIFTLAVLVHLHTDSEFVLEEMKVKANKFIITIEDEWSTGPRHCARKYKEVFEDLGMRQIFYAAFVPGLNEKYCARAFEKLR